MRVDGAPAPPTDGERWAREALADLRAGRFGARAWLGFLAASGRRAGERARARPDLAREALLWSAAGALPWGGLALVDARSLWGLGWWALVGAMLWWHVGMVEGPAGEPRSGLGAASALTLARAWLVPALPLLAGQPWAFAAAVAAGGLTDAVDGPIARRRGEVTRLGAHVDASTDVAVALAAAWTAAGEGWVPVWAAPAVTVRYALPPLAIALFYLARAAPPPTAAVVRGRLPGLAVALGLALCPIEAARGPAAALLAAGLA
ncbi:MAG: CDP-alcohol phosphatidyltransferase, partial [Miltoncostaeaceae bacterium]|nr:CDP-alcohol phosphatidyltransferase [Miltoncostaeaceae bacterium]